MRRALYIGVDRYSGSPLTGCVRDATRIATVLAKHQDGSPNFDGKLIVAPATGRNDVVTKAVLRQHLQQLFKDEADVALFYFAGHGTANELGGYLTTQDAAQYDDGVALQEVLKLANDSKVHEIVMLLDSCFSGALGNAPLIDNSKAILREGVSILTASRNDQVSIETGGGGMFTSLVIEALEGGAANVIGSVSAPSVYAFVEAALGAWDQRPLFKAHVSKVVELRRCTPPIQRDVLRRLPELFPSPTEDLVLDPTVGHTSPTANLVHIARCRDLEALNRVHLVAPIPAMHVPDAALQCTGWQLTPSGRYYWRLAKEGRI